MWLSGIISAITNWAKKLTLKDALWIAVVVLMLLFLRECNRNSGLKSELRVATQNEVALTDSIQIIQSENGGLIAQKAVLVKDKEALQKANSGLANEVKRLKKSGVNGDIQTITDIGATLGSKEDQIVEAQVVYISPEGDVRLSLELDTIYDERNSRHLAGYVEFYIDSMKVENVRAVLTEDQINIALSTGLVKDEDGIYRIYVQSDYPGFNVTHLDGAILEPKMLKELGLQEDAWIIGPHVGYGFGPGQDRATPFVGVGVTYNLNKQVKSIFRK